MLRCPVCARPPATQACSCCIEACYISQALRLILSPRGSAPALVRHAASRFNSISRHVGTCCKPFAQRGDSRSHSFATRLAACAHAAVSAARRRTVKERRKKLHPIERAMHARSREAAAAIERPGLPRLSSLEGLSVRQSAREETVTYSYTCVPYRIVSRTASQDRLETVLYTL